VVRLPIRFDLKAAN